MIKAYDIICPWCMKEIELNDSINHHGKDIICPYCNGWFHASLDIQPSYIMTKI